MILTNERCDTVLCCVTDLREKEVVNIRDGARIGCVCDVDIDTCSGRITAIIIYGKCKFMGVFARVKILKYIGKIYA